MLGWNSCNIEQCPPKAPVLPAQIFYAKQNTEHWIHQLDLAYTNIQMLLEVFSPVIAFMFQ